MPGATCGGRLASVLEKPIRVSATLKPRPAATPNTRPSTVSGKSWRLGRKSAGKGLSASWITGMSKPRISSAPTLTVAPFNGLVVYWNGL